MGIPGGWELLVVAFVVILIFGAKKLPQLGGAVGESIKNFKKGIKDSASDDDKPETLKASSAEGSNEGTSTSSGLK